jgi:hypothetical protein
VKKLVAITVFLVLSFVAPQSKADLHEFSISASDKTFFEQIRTAVLADDVEWFSEAVHYPIVLRPSNGEIKINNKKDFKKHATLVFTTLLKSTLQNQSPDSLFKNWQGVMIGNGEIWFSKVGEKTENGIVWTYRIIGINLPKDQSKQTQKGVQPKPSPVGKTKSD